jgi:hypothetical protein
MFKSATPASALSLRILIWKGQKKQGVEKTFLFFSRLSGTFFFFASAFAFFSSFSFMKSFSLASQKLKMSSSGKDFDDADGRRRDTETKKKKATTTTTTTTTKDALERALSRHEKYVSSSSEGRFAEDLGIHLLSFFLSAVQRTDSKFNLFNLCKAENRKDATRKVAKLTSTLVSGINRGVLEVFENQKEVEKEAKVLQKKVDAFKCESRTWVKSLRDFDESLKSIGDFENYVMTLENELKGIAEELKKRKEQ